MATSERERVQLQIAAALSKRRDYWNAPYGIIASLHRLENGGAYRSITFGVARYLDAEVRIWTPTVIEISGEGALAPKVEGTFESVDEAIAHLEEVAA